MRTLKRLIVRVYYPVYYFFWTEFARTVFRLTLRCTVTGKENVPPHGPLIIASNHMSLLDPSLVASSIPRTVRFVAKAELYKNPIGAFMIASYGSIKVNRDQPGKEQFVAIKRELDRDAAVVIFPEGTRNGGQLIRAKAGIALIAAQAGAPIVPVGITGSKGLEKFPFFFPRKRVTITIGEPFSLPALEGTLGRAQLAALSDMVMQRVAATLPPEYRGYYAVRPTSGPATDKAG